jgi:hypothetical protein
MKVMFESEQLDINSTEMKPMILRGVNIGEYSYGLYSKLQKKEIRERKDIIVSFENYICGIIHDYFQIDVLTANDVKNAEKICQEKFSISLNEWVNKELQTKLEK